VISELRGRMIEGRGGVGGDDRSYSYLSYLCCLNKYSLVLSRCRFKFAVDKYNRMQMQIRKPILFSSNTTYLHPCLPLYLPAIESSLACLPLYSKGTPHLEPQCAKELCSRTPITGLHCCFGSCVESGGAGLHCGGWVFVSGRLAIDRTELWGF
jgi:hypothetical protein